MKYLPSLYLSEHVCKTSELEELQSTEVRSEPGPVRSQAASLYSAHISTFPFLAQTYLAPHYWPARHGKNDGILYFPGQQGSTVGFELSWPLWSEGLEYFQDYPGSASGRGSNSTLLVSLSLHCYCSSLLPTSQTYSRWTGEKLGISPSPQTII